MSVQMDSKWPSLLSFPEQVAWFESLSYAALREYVHMVLWKGRFLPPIAIARQVELDEVLPQVFRSSSSPEFQTRFRGVLVELLENWSPVTDPQSSLARLLIIVGRTGGAYCRETLVRFANTGSFKGSIVDGEDLHLRVLRVLVGIGVRESDIWVLSRDLQEPTYAPICYRGLYEADLRNAIGYCSQLVKVAYASQHAFPLDYLLDQVISVVGRQRFFESLGEILQELALDESTMLLKALWKLTPIALLQGEDDFIYFGYEAQEHPSAPLGRCVAFRDDVDARSIFRVYAMEGMSKVKSGKEALLDLLT